MSGCARRQAHLSLWPPADVPAPSWHCRKAPAKAPAAGQNNSDFRARRLSVAGVEEALPVAGAKKGGTPTAGGRRARRMSMRCARGTPAPLAPQRHRSPTPGSVPGSPEMGVIKPKALLPFAVEAVGTYSCHGVEPGIRQGETSAKINQDRGCVCFPFGSDSATKPMALFCVFDGHGAPPAPRSPLRPPAAVRFVCDACEPSRCRAASPSASLHSLLPPSRHPPRVFLWPCRRAGRQGLPLRDERDPEEARGPPVPRE